MTAVTAVPPMLVQLVKTSASLAACYMFASPMHDIRRVHRSKTTGTMQLLPLLSMFGNCACWTMYGLLARAYFPLMATNAVGLGFSTLYWIVYHRHSPPAQKPMVRKQMTMVLAALVVLGLYPTFSVAPRKVVQANIGYVAIGVCTIMFASPLAVVKQVVQKKNADLLPFGMIVAGFVNSVLWLSYGFILADNFVIMPNVVNLVLGSIQLALFCIFPKQRRYEHVLNQSEAKV
ncbi:TPA: hypothetical protein N0F65_004986 [Lagenidium giganteum]|uniref:Sugar transporter SWEET1 n=1 Tax=Lagenidium giganteum TaxID=4803 RepID=A0AAV2ZGF7_9STRA|nr:TPA: hypothetical protein N0F65_004986 [Lagenidium giganteum]